MDPVLMPRLTVLSICLLLLSLASWIILKPKDWEWSFTFLFSKFSIPFCLFLISGLASVLMAENVVETSWVLVKDFLFVGLMLLLPSVYSQFKNWKDYLFKGFLFAILISSSYGFYQLRAEFITITVQEIDLYSLSSTFAHRNLWGGFLVLSMPFLVFAFYSFKGFWRGFAIVLLVNNLFWIYFLESRSSWLALGVFGLMFLFSWLSAKFNFKVSRLFTRLSALILILVLGIGFFVFYFSARDNLQSQELGFNLKVEASEKSFTVQERVLLWKGTGLMIQDNNLLGVGLGNWKIQFPKYGSDIWRARQGLVQFQRPHNDFLWVLSEQGIVGLLSYVFMFLVMIYFAFKNSENFNLSKADRILSRLILAGLFSYLSISFFSFPKERIVHQWILYVSFSILIFHFLKGSSTKKFSIKKFQILPIVTIIIGVLGFWIGLQRWKGEVYTQRILGYNVNAQWKQMAEISEEVGEITFYNLDPSSVPISFYEGLAQLNENNRKKALELFEAAEEAHPNMIHVINNIAACHQFNGDYKMAIKYFKKALKISPKYQDGILNLAAAHFNANEVMNAYEVLLNHQSSFPEENENYNNYIQVLIKVIRENLAETVQNEKLKNSILQLNDEWLLQIHNKVILDSIPVDQRILMDAIYRMEILEESIDLKQAEDLKNLYLNK